jgi:hypothetical protein
MLSAERGWASRSPALRVGLSSPIGSTCARGSRGAGEVQHADVDVDRERAGREAVRRGRGGTGWIGGQVLAGRQVQAGPGRVLALPSGRPLRLHAHDGDPAHRASMPACAAADRSVPPAGPRSEVVSRDGPDARLLNDHDRQRSRTTRA